MEPQRPRSIRSVASNSSIASGVSLARRSRTRTRSKTVTGASRPDDLPPSPRPPSDLPYLDGPALHEPHDVLDAPLQHPPTAAPDRPPRSSQRLQPVVDTRSSDTASSQNASLVDPTFIDPTQSTALSLSSKPSKAAKQASVLPHLDTGYRPPPSAFSRDPALTPALNVRDSISTQQSGVSSSLYPPSTSTASAPESPTSPMSMAAETEAPPFALEVNDVQEYDSDDVSYRLRLLVKNNYFLPPAHSKPSAADFAPPPDLQKKSPRMAAPAFLDIFRVGKARSKPTTPTVPGFNPMAPMLRTTSESIASPHQAHPRTSGQFGHPSPPLGAPPSRGRVVVVREKMQDIAVAAKQAEQDLKARGARIDQGSQKTSPAADNNIIDPTDAVDIPLPSPSYPFAVQASALHGLGVLESLGADVLADHLPPSQNPNLSVSYDEVEDSWRKAILKQAVHHSLDNTPDASTFSHVLNTSISMDSPRARDSEASRVPAVRRMIDQRIAPLPTTDEDVKPVSSKHVRQKSAHSQASTSKGKSKLTVPITTSKLESRPSSGYQRAETPSGPMTPLQPPPRRAFMNPAYSISQTELSPSSSPNRLASDDSRRALRRTVSSPLLAEGFDSLASRRGMSPPPLPRFTRDSQATFTSFNTIARTYNGVDGTPSEHHGSDIEGGRAASFRSTMLSRPSLSEYSQASLSPTTSAFQDALNRSQSRSSGVGPSRLSMEHGQEISVSSSAAARAVAASPPPRMSSSLAHAALPPPPRSSSFGYLLKGNSAAPPPLPAPRPRAATSEDSTFQILAPEPSSPPLPLPAGRGFSNRAAIYIDDATDLSTALHAAPGPASPTSFFDSIQAQPNAMDDLESSDDESESDDERPDELPPPARTLGDARARAISSASEGARPPVMRHGKLNFSAPYIRAGEGAGAKQPVGSRAPVAHTPLRPSKNDILASSDFFRYAQEHPPVAMPSVAPDAPPAADPDVAAWRNNQRAQESLRKLDGMLIQHMEDEKDTIKRIATTLKQTADSLHPGHPYR